jgi:hypothetical protein
MRFKLLLIGVILFTVFGLFLLLLFGPNSGGTVSPQTTYITTPLAADGLPSYGQALLDEQRKGITPEDNGAVLFWRAMGPGDLKPAQFRLLCQELAINPPPAPPYLVSVSDDAVRQAVVEWIIANRTPTPSSDDAAMVDESDGAVIEAVDAELALDSVFDPEIAVDEFMNEISAAPWTAADCPPLAEWVADNEELLDLVVGATAKPQFYSPSPSLLENPDGALIEMLLPALNIQRSAARSLAARATFRMGRGEYDEAWQDCLALWRLGDQVAQGPVLVEQLVAAAIRGVARECTLALLAEDELPPEMSRKVLADLNAVSPGVPMAPSFAKAERYMYLDFVLRTLSGRLGGGAEDFSEGLSGPVQALSFNVDEPLRIGNIWYDRLAKAAAMTDLQARRTALTDYENDLQALAGSVKPALVGSLFSRGKRSETVGNVFVSLLMPALKAAIDVEDRDAAGLVLTRIAAALAVYRAEHGDYPETLAELTPAVLPEPLLDRYNSQPPIYARRGEGYVLYSVFQNGVDDGGDDATGAIVDGEWLPADQQGSTNVDLADLVIRMPRRPLRPLLPTPAE